MRFNVQDSYQAARFKSTRVQTGQFIAPFFVEGEAVRLFPFHSQGGRSSLGEQGGCVHGPRRRFEVRSYKGGEGAQLPRTVKNGAINWPVCILEASAVVKCRLRALRQGRRHHRQGLSRAANARNSGFEIRSFGVRVRTPPHGKPQRALDPYRTAPPQKDSRSDPSGIESETAQTPDDNQQ